MFEISTEEFQTYERRFQTIPTSYDLHMMHNRWQFKSRCQQAGPNEQRQGTMPCLSCGSFTQSLKALIQTRSVLSRQQLRLCCVHLQTPSHAFVSALCSPVHFCAELLPLSFTSWQAGSQVYTLFSFPLHVSIHVTAGAPCPNSTLPAIVCREGKGGEVEKKEQVGTFFRGPVIFYLISQELLDYKSKVCQRKREDNKTQTEAVHSSLHQEKSHPRAKPATFLGPLTLFRVSLSLCGLCCGIYKWKCESVFNARLWLLCQGLF